MKVIFTGTIAAVVLGAAIASSQTPEPAQPTAPVAAEQAQPAQPQADAPRQPAADRAQAPRSQSTTTYRGILKGSAANGWTIAPIAARAAASTSTPGATATAGASTSSSTTTYNVLSTDAKVDLASMADQCVEIVGSLLPESSSSSAAASPAAGAAAGARSSASSNRTLTVTTIRAMQGGCTQ